jgi:hypothetical protein
VITEPLLTNGHLLWLHYSGFQAVITEVENGHIPSQYVLVFV